MLQKYSRPYIFRKKYLLNQKKHKSFQQLMGRIICGELPLCHATCGRHSGKLPTAVYITSTFYVLAHIFNYILVLQEACNQPTEPNAKSKSAQNDKSNRNWTVIQGSLDGEGHAVCPAILLHKNPGRSQRASTVALPPRGPLPQHVQWPHSGFEGSPRSSS